MNDRDKEVTVYDEERTLKETTGRLPPKDELEGKCRYYKRLLCFCGSLCCCLLLGIIGVCVHLALQPEMASDLKRQIDYSSAENRNLTARNEELQMQIKELRTENQNLTKQIYNMESNVSRAQWSLDAYCPKTNNGRTCANCQGGWLFNQPSCYAINNPDAPNQKTWEAARQDCIMKNSDLVVVANDAEKTVVNGYSWERPQAYWLGLRVENGTWKWINGSDLMNNTWISGGTDGDCAVSIQNQNWTPRRCDQRNRWFCKKKAIDL